MTNDKQLPKNSPPCPGCGGSGQTSYFGGESRFMLTWEDCPDCCGTGVLLSEEEPAGTRLSPPHQPVKKP